MTTASVLEVCVVHEIIEGYYHPTAIDKRPVLGAVPVGELGPEDDEHVDSAHGGRDAAVYVYADEDAGYFADLLGRPGIPPGLFGENLRVTGLDVSGARLGEQWQVGDGVANTVIAQLIHLESESPDSPINLYLNSPGGSIPAMLAIYDAMQFVRPTVETTCVGQAVATAAVLLAGGAPGRRQILRHGRVVLHAPAAEGRGTIPDLILEAEEVERVRSLLEELLAQDTGRSAHQVREDTERDLVLTAEQALEYGVVDAVITARDGVAAGAPAQAARQTGD
jgi:ATP-dependent Clp protease protease subunit